MTNSHLTLPTDLPAALRRLNRPPGLPETAIGLGPSRTRTALIDAADIWRRRCRTAGEAVGEHLSQLERFATALCAGDEHQARRLAVIR